MINPLRRFFRVGRVLVAEVQPELGLGQEAKEACARLGEHPGFQYLCQQLRRHRGALKAALEICEAKDLVRLQEGLKWSAWLERYIAHEAKVKAAHRKEISLAEHEQRVLRDSLASVSVIE